MIIPPRFLLAVVGAAALGALLLGQTHPGKVVYQPPSVGRYQMEQAPNGREIYVLDTATGEIRRVVVVRPGGLPSDLGKPFELLIDR